LDFLQGNHTSSISMSPVFKILSLNMMTHDDARQTFPDFSGLEIVSEKLRFRDRLVWTVGLALEIEVPFRVSPNFSSN